jgi:8-oxo-dGTP pyrophosphatase MutT (NUDIX family)
MVASAFLPVAWHKGNLYFLFGKERDEDSSPGFSDFGGGVEKNEDIYNAGLREMAEETTGFFGGPDEIRAYVDSQGGVYPLVHEKYHIHIFRSDYEPKLIDYYNRNHKYIYDHMDHDYLKQTKIFEKVEIQWMTLDDMKRRRSEFRQFYRVIVDKIIKESPKIMKFVRKQGKGKDKGNKTRRIRRP